MPHDLGRIDNVALSFFSASQAGALRRVPGRALPLRARRARWRVLHPGRVERRSPAAVVILGELQVEPLPVHPDGNAPDAGPGIQPGAKSVQRTIVGEHRAPGEAESRHQKPAALVEHAAKVPTWRRGVNGSGRFDRDGLISPGLIGVRARSLACPRPFTLALRGQRRLRAALEGDVAQAIGLDRLVIE